MDIFYSKSISVLYRKFQVYINNEFKRFDISSSEYTYLVTLLFGGDGLEQGELTKITAINKAAVTRGIQSLEKKGYVYRVPSENNPNYKKIFLTDKAKDIKEEVYSVLKKWNELIGEGLGENEAKELNEKMERMADNAYEYVENMKNERSKK